MPGNDLHARIRSTMTDIVRLPSPPGHEERVREYLQGRLEVAGIPSQLDQFGNLLALVPATTETEASLPLLFTAHMDRVSAPGMGGEPVIHGDQMLSDGTTNLGADDAAGITIILLMMESLLEDHIPHGPLLLLFTRENEIGLRGASEFDPVPWRVREGIVFENADVPGVVVLQGAQVITFDVVMHGITGHPGKDLSGTASAIEMFRRLELKTGQIDDATRISLGVLKGGAARNAIAESLTALGELRTQHGLPEQERKCIEIRKAFEIAAAGLGGRAEVIFERTAPSYTVDLHEPLVQAYKEAWQDEGHAFQGISTFVGGDVNALRGRLGLNVFTVSIGVIDEHTFAETISLTPLATLIKATTRLVSRYRSRPAVNSSSPKFRR